MPYHMGHILSVYFVIHLFHTLACPLLEISFLEKTKVCYKLMYKRVVFDFLCTILVLILLVDLYVI